MFDLKKNLQILGTIMSVFVTTHTNATTSGDKKQLPVPKKIATQETIVSAQQSECEHEHTTHVLKRKKLRDPYNGTVWVGGGFLFFPSTLESFTQDVTVDYQIGVSKSIYNITPDMFFYWGLIFDYAYSNERLGQNAARTFRYKLKYHFTNEQLLLGYETGLGVPYVSLFLEAGGVFQQRSFSITEPPPTYDITTGFGGSMNAGFNLRIVPRNHVSYLFRFACNAMIGGRREITINYNSQRLNINPVSIVPSLSFGIRI